MNTSTHQSNGRKPISLSHRTAVGSAISFALVLLSVASNNLHAAITTVTSTADDGAGSLRAAVAAAADGDEINFSLPAQAAITLTTGELTVSKNLTISGPGPANLSISGNTNGRVFNIAADRTVNLSGLTIRNGRANNGDSGGGIFNAGILTLRNCDVSFNTAGNGSGALAGGNGGGIFNSGSLNVTGCSFRSNYAGTGVTGNSRSAFGGSMTSGGPGGGGGAIFNSGSLTLESCTFYDNRAGAGGTGGGTSLGGVAASGGTGGSGGVDIGASEGVSTSFSRSEALLVGNGLNNSIAAIEVRSGAAVGTFVQPAAGASYQTFGPRGMLCVGNQLLVVNQNVDQPYNGEVLKFDLNTGAFTGKMVPSSNANAPYAPRGMIAGPNGVLYVADVGGFDGVHPGRIARYNNQGVFLGNVNTTGLSVPFYPMGLVTGPDGLLYVAGVGNLAQGSSNGFVFRFQFNAGTQNYHYLSTIVSSTAANFYAPGLHAPEGIVCGPDGNIYVVSFYAAFNNSQGTGVTDRDAILVFNRSGQRIGPPISLYEAGETRVFAQTMLFGPRGDLFVPVTSDRGVRRYSASSNFQEFTVLPSSGESPGQPWYLTFRATNPGTLAYEPPQLDMVRNGDRFDVSWPANYVGWQLQVQINGDLSDSNWVNVTESIGTNLFSLLPNASDSRAFFRLVAP